MRPGASQNSGIISQAWRSQDGQTMAVLGAIGAVSLPPYDGLPGDLIGRRVRLVDGRWLLVGAGA